MTLLLQNSKKIVEDHIYIIYYSIMVDVNNLILQLQSFFDKHKTEKPNAIVNEVVRTACPTVL